MYFLVDMFPFKFEIKQYLDDYLDSKFGKNSEYRKANKIRLPPHLFAVYLSYLDYDNKEKLFRTLEHLGLKHYMIKPKPEQLEYLKILPASIITKEILTNDEKKLIDLSGLAYDKQGEIQEVHKFLFDKVTSNLTMSAFVDVLKDFDNYAYWYSVITSRSYKINLNDYERLFDIDVEAGEIGKKHKKLILDVASQGKYCINKTIKSSNV